MICIWASGLLKSSIVLDGQTILWWSDVLKRPAEINIGSHPESVNIADRLSLLIPWPLPDHTLTGPLFIRYIRTTSIPLATGCYAFVDHFQNL
jgi:hypothetical protein